MTEATSKHPSKHQREKQNNTQNELQENFLMWIIRYVMIPIVLAGIAGFFAIAVVDRSFQHENEQPDDPVFTKIFGTMTAAAATAQPTPGLAPTLTVTAVPTQTSEPPAEEPNTANKPPITSVPPQSGSPAVCPQVPLGWQLYTVQPGNTLFSLARETGTTVATIRQVNCLYGELLAYSQIWLPDVFVGRQVPTATNTPTKEATALPPTSTATTTATATVTESTPTPLPDVINDTRDWPSFYLSCPEECIPVIRFAVSNAGAGAARAFNIRLQFTANSGSVVTLDQAVAGLTPGGGNAFSLANSQLIDCYDLGCQICITVDSFNNVVEENEANNQYCQTFAGQGGGRG